MLPAQRSRRLFRSVQNLVRSTGARQRITVSLPPAVVELIREASKRADLTPSEWLLDRIMGTLLHGEALFLERQFYEPPRMARKDIDGHLRAGHARFLAKWARETCTVYVMGPTLDDAGRISYRSRVPGRKHDVVIPAENFIAPLVPRER